MVLKRFSSNDKDSALDKLLIERRTRAINMGSTLSGLMLGEFYSIFLPVIDVLAELQNRNILHRDIKPSNIFICRQAAGRFLPILFDFGLSVDWDKQKDFDFSSCEGTLPFLSPEQFIPPENFKNIDHKKADIFSIGMTMHYSLVNKHPFELLNEPPYNQYNVKLLENKGKEIEEEWFKQGCPIKAGELFKIRPDIQYEFCEMIEKCISFKSEDRPSINELYNKMKELQPPQLQFVQSQNAVIEKFEADIESNNKVFRRIQHTMTYIEVLTLILILFTASLFGFSVYNYIKQNDSMEQLNIRNNELTSKWEQTFYGISNLLGTKILHKIILEKAFEDYLVSINCGNRNDIMKSFSEAFTKQDSTIDIDQFLRRFSYIPENMELTKINQLCKDNFYEMKENNINEKQYYFKTNYILYGAISTPKQANEYLRICFPNRKVAHEFDLLTPGLAMQVKDLTNSASKKTKKDFILEYLKRFYDNTDQYQLNNELLDIINHFIQNANNTKTVFSDEKLIWKEMIKAMEELKNLSDSDKKLDIYIQFLLDFSTQIHKSAQEDIFMQRNRYRHLIYKEQNLVPSGNLSYWIFGDESIVISIDTSTTSSYGFLSTDKDIINAFKQAFLCEFNSIESQIKGNQNGPKQRN
jgi:cell division protein FtsB